MFIAEDDVFISEQLEYILIDLGYEVTGIGFNYESSVELLNNVKPDLAILDIKMHGEDLGFVIADYINKHLEIPFIFLTSFSDKATVKEAVAYKPQGYLVKPFNERDIYSTLEVIKSKIDKPSDVLVLKDGRSQIKVDSSEILWIKSDDKYIEIQTTSRKVVLRTSISKFLEDYPSVNLLRVHRSYVVNLQNVEEIMSDEVLIGGKKIPLSRTHKEQLRSRFGDIK